MIIFIKKITLYILQAPSAWGDSPTWVQAGTGIISVILAAFTLFQTKKIVELLEIVLALNDQNIKLVEQTAELARQTDELKQMSEINKARFEIEEDIALYSRIANFQFRGEVHEHVIKRNHVIHFFLVNRGAAAYGLHSRTRTEIDPVTIGYCENIVDENNHVDVSFKYPIIDNVIFQSGCRFDIYYSDDRGNLIKQTIEYLRETKPTISKPVLTKE